MNKFRSLIDPHIDNLGEDNPFPRWIYCEEGTNYCHMDDRKGRIDVLNDDFVFLMDSDDLPNGIIRLLPSHRECAVNEWGEDHIIPKPESNHAKFARQLVTEGPAIGETHL